MLVFLHMKYLNIFLKIVLSLILLTPILGAAGIFPAPTRDLYNTDEAYAFITMLGYISYMIAAINGVALVLMWTGRMALAMLLILPIVVNIVAFHAFMDGGLLTPGAILANAIAFLNAYFLWQNRARYASLLEKSSTF